MTCSAPLWTSQQAAAATGGRSSASWVAAGVGTDSRSLKPGDLFVALTGPNHDGHDWLEAARARGAAAAMVAASRLADVQGCGLPLLAVPSPADGLVALGTAAVARGAATRIGITGSAGKTGTKNALAHVLAGQGSVHATEGNLNNHIGLPLTLARMPADSRFAVLEMGMSAPGEIRALTRLARPQVAVITTIAAAHLEFFGSLAGIAAAKAEILEGLPPAGHAILPRDNALFHDLRAHALDAGVAPARILGFGAHPEADFRLLSWTPDAGGGVMAAVCQGQHLTVRLASFGRHLALNSLAVLAAVRCAGADMASAAEALAGVMPPAGRGRRRRFALPGGGLATLIDESYNANPASMRAAIDDLGHAVPAPGGRRVAVLGDMVELGPQAAALHDGLAAPLRAAGVDLLFAAGPRMAGLAAHLPPRLLAGTAGTGPDLLPLLRAALLPGDIVLVKGSNSIGMQSLVRALAPEDTPARRESEQAHAV